MSRIAAQMAIDDTNLHRSISKETEEEVLRHLTRDAEVFKTYYSGDPMGRRPVHAFYGGAHLFRSETAAKLGQLALSILETNAPDFTTLSRVVGPNIAGFTSQSAMLRFGKSLVKDAAGLKKKNHKVWLAYTVYRRVLEKLSSQAIEDYRIDFEDGFGYRGDAEEDHEARRTAEETVKAMEEKTLPPFFGIRIKSLSEELKRRSLRTLDIYLTSFCEKSGGRLPDNFVINLPKVVSPEQITVLISILKELESKLKLPDKCLKFEFMVETPQVILGSEGVSLLPAIVKAGEGRCVAAHFGPYDYTTALGIAPALQTLDHPACDHARHVMQTALAGTGVALSDGAVHRIPVGPNRAGTKPLTAKQKKENRETVHEAWKSYYDLVRRSLHHGFYQSWDLHPGHLPMRYAAVFSFYLEGLDAAASRLGSYLDKGAQASLSGQMFDDAASGQGLLNFILRGIYCGAFSKEDLALAGLSYDEILSGSFSEMVKKRQITKK